MARLAGVVRAVLWLLRLLRVGRAAAMTNGDLAASAHGLSYAMLATRWQRRAKAPAWDEVHANWGAALPTAGSVDPALWGRFDRRDRWALLTDNAEAFRVRDRLYRGATHSIELSTYYIQADEAGWRTARALAACAARGVRVRVIVDRCVTATKIYQDPAVLEVIRSLENAGVEHRVFADPRRPYDACHRKVLLVDGRSLLIGGRNYADHYAGGDWRDVDLLLQGPSAARVQACFEETFASRPRAQAGEEAGTIFQATAPTAISENGSFLYLLQCIRACRGTLDIENAYYIAHAPVQRELVAAARRGVRVRLFTNSAESNDLPFMNFRLQAGLPELVDAGIEVYLRPGAGRTLHGKYFIADGEWVGFGSSNLDFYSPRFCVELGVHVRDARFGRRLTAWFEQGIAQATRVEDRAAIDQVLAHQTVGRLFDRWWPDIQ